MMANSIAILLLIVISPSVFAQQPYELPFGSSGNTLELTIANASGIVANNVTVESSSTPSWLDFSPTQQRFDHLGPGEELAAAFRFSVDKSAPVNTVQTLRFVIINSTGESWTKEISISVAPPDRFELFQNYPNPFNPATTISYQLSKEAKVSLRIYDILGREVATLVDADRPAGYHEERWDASQFASGMYVYQITLTDQQNHRQVFRKTMLILK